MTFQSLQGHCSRTSVTVSLSITKVPFLCFVARGTFFFVIFHFSALFCILKMDPNIQAKIEDIEEENSDEGSTEDSDEGKRLSSDTSTEDEAPLPQPQLRQNLPKLDLRVKKPPQKIVPIIKHWGESFAMNPKVQRTSEEIFFSMDKQVNLVTLQDQERATKPNPLK